MRPQRFVVAMQIKERADVVQVICTTELFKLVLSYALEVRTRRQALHKKDDGDSLVKHLRSPINELLYTRREESLRMFFPAFCYAVVNMCSYAGIKLLDLPTYIITWQLKILAAALFGWLLYQREVSARKWLALFILVSGLSFLHVLLLADRSRRSNARPTATDRSIITSSNSRLHPRHLHRHHR